MIKKEKQAYMAPTTDVLELRVESKILDGSLRGMGFSDPNADVDDQSGADWWNN